MSILDDLNSAIRDYCETNVTLSILCDLNADNIQPATAGDRNKDEIWRFRVRVSNNGLLNITNVMLRLLGEGADVTNHAKVSPSATGPWFESLMATAILSIESGGSAVSSYYYVKIPSGPSNPTLGAVPFVKVHIQEFNANLNHILNNQTGYSIPPEAVFVDQLQGELSYIIF